MAFFRASIGGGGGTSHCGVITNVDRDTEYTIDTGLTTIKNFCSLQSPFTTAANQNFASVYDEDNPGYFVRAVYLSGVSNGVYVNSFSDTMANNSIGMYIRNISGGVVTIRTGKYNNAANKQDIHWFAS